MMDLLALLGKLFGLLGLAVAAQSDPCSQQTTNRDEAW